MKKIRVDGHIADMEIALPEKRQDCHLGSCYCLPDKGWARRLLDCGYQREQTD